MAPIPIQGLMKNGDHYSKLFQMELITENYKGKKAWIQVYIWHVNYAALDPFTFLFSLRLSFLFDKIFIIGPSYLLQGIIVKTKCLRNLLTVKSYDFL